MTENIILLVSLLACLIISLFMVFLMRHNLRRRSRLKKVVITGSLFISGMLIGSAIAFFLCRSFSIQTPPLLPYSTTSTYKNQLGLFRHASQYDDGVALGLVQLSALAYENENKVRKHLVAMGFLNANIHYFSKKNNIVIIIVDKDTIAIAFRGTDPDDREDLLTDINIVPDSSAMMVHSGFKQALDTLWSDVISVVHNEQVQGAEQKSIFITGHSLGGAIATLAAARLEASGRDVTALYTFGQPPVGGEIFSRHMNNLSIKHYRFINHLDIVTKAPSAALHTGEVRYFDVFGKLYSEQPFCQRLYDSAIAPVIESGAEWLAHGIERYKEALNARQEESRQQN